MTQGGRGKKRCHFPPEGDTIGNAITRKCKLGMLTYITMDISLCPPKWYQSAKFRVLAHALEGQRLCLTCGKNIGNASNANLRSGRILASLSHRSHILLRGSLAKIGPDTISHRSSCRRPNFGRGNLAI